MADANETVELTLDQANRLFTSGSGTTLGILKAADAELSKRLHAVTQKGGKSTAQLKFSEAQALAYREQIRLVTAYAEKRLQGHSHEQASKAVAKGVKSTVKLLTVLEKRYTGIGKPLQLESQAMQDEVTRGVAASLLRSNAASWQRYGAYMVADFERVMRQGALEGLTQHQVISRLVQAGELGGIKASKLHENEPAYFPKPAGYVTRRYWAERIVRTETAYAYNAANDAAIRRSQKTDFPDMKRKILAHFDNRTAPDSIAVHGQIRGMEELFVDGAGRHYKHPPARPNDRETVIPWRMVWPELPATHEATPEQKAQAELEAAGLAPVAEGQNPVQASNAKIVALVEKHKAAAAQKAAETQQAQGFAQALQAAQAAQLQGTQAMGAAKLADAAAVARAQALQQAKAAKVGGSVAELKAKAAAYKQEAAAKAQALSDAQKAAGAAAFKAWAGNLSNLFVEDAKAASNPASDLVANIKNVAKKKPELFKEMQAQAGVRTKLKSEHAQSVELAKKLLPEGDYSQFGKKPKPKPEAAPPKPAVPVFTFKEVSGYVDVHDPTGAKVAYFKPGPGGFVVTPPPLLEGFSAKTFASKEEAAPYAVEVATAIKAKAAAQLAEMEAKLAEKKKLDALNAEQKAEALKDQLAKPQAMNWSNKWRAPERREIAMTKRGEAIDAGLSKPSRAGVSVAADADFVEDFQIQFVHRVVDGQPETVARFRVNAQRAEAVVDKLSDDHRAKPVRFEGFPKLKDLKSKTLDMSTDGAVLGGQLPGRVDMLQAKVGETTVRFFMSSGSQGEHPAMRNIVEVRIPEVGLKPGDRWKKFQETAKAMGIETHAPKPEDLQTYTKTKVLNVADRVGATHLNGIKNPTPADVDKVWAQAVKRDPRLQEIADDAKLREVAPGQYALYSGKLAERYRAAGITHLTHNLAGDANVMELIFNTEEGGLLSSRERFQRGLIFRGMSTETDFATGGADSVFTRLATGPGQRTARGFMLIDPSELGRLDAYAFGDDNYGRTSDDNRAKRLRLSDVEALMQSGRKPESDNETMFRRAIPPSSIRRLLVKDQSEKRSLIQRLENAGVTEIGGVPLDEFIGAE